MGFSGFDSNSSFLSTSYIAMVRWDSFLVELWISRKFLKWVRWAQENSQGLGVEMVFSRKPSIDGWRLESSSRYGEEILRHLSLFWFCDILTGFGEINVV